MTSSPEDITTRRENAWFRVASYVILVAAGVVGLRFDPPASALVRWTILLLLVGIGMLQIWVPKGGSQLWRCRLQIGLNGAMVAALMFIQPGWTMYPVLFIPPIVQAILLLPLREGVAWVVTFTLVAATTFAVGISLGEGVVAIFLYGVLYAFIAAFASALTRVDAARRESQRLLGELQDAHEQLQAGALRMEEMAVVEERNRLAREMHDTLGHRLTVAAVQLEAAQRLCPTDAGRATRMVGTVREQVQEALRELRATVATLRTPVEADLHLRSALRRLVDQFEGATGMTVHRVLPEALPELPDAHRMALFRAAQEALTNVQKHAAATQVWLVLSLGEGADAVSLLVSDDGNGVVANGEGGFGLVGLRERADLLGGELHVEPRSGGGTQLSFRLPLGESA